jgi:LuxR family maltose regulon positive regulatory protein
MPTTVDRSKFSPPQAPANFSRNRLLTQIWNKRHKSLLLVVGQAGQGKSTLVAKVVEVIEYPTVWVNVDPSDSDPPSFLIDLMAAFKNKWDRLDFSPLLNNLGTRVSAENAQAVYVLWARNFWQVAPDTVRIVLDALEQVPEKSQTYLLIEALIQYAPSSARFVLVSRIRPPLKVERLIIDGKAFVIENAAMAFSSDEIALFLEHYPLFSFDDELVSLISTYTEGWLVGIIIIAQWLSRDSSHSRIAQLQEQLKNGAPREIITYFAEEVFNSLDSEERQFLIKTAFLETLEPALINTLLNIDHSAAILQRLARDYLFIQTFTDPTGKLLFRYHLLFRRFLFHLHQSEIGTTEQRELCQKAAVYYAERDLPQTSLTLFLHAQQYTEAENILRQIGSDLIACGQSARLADYIDGFPPRERQQSAWLLMFHCITIRTLKAAEALEILCRCREQFKVEEDLIGLTLVLSYMIETAFLVGYSPVDMDKLLTEGRDLLNDAHYIPQGIQGQLWSQIGFAAIRGIGNFSQALSACQTGYMLAKQANNSNLQCQCLVLSKLACAYLGEFKEADILNRKIQHILPNVSTEIQTFDLSAQCVLNIYRGRRREALEDLQRFEANVEKYGLNHFFTWLIIYKCLLYPRINKVTEAEQILSGWLRFCKEPTFARAMAQLFVGFCAYYRSAVMAGTDALEEAAAIFKEGHLRSEFQYQAARKGLGIAAYLRKDYATATSILDEVLAYAKSINSHTLTADAHLLLGLNYYANKDHPAAGRHLKAGFEIMTARRYTQIVVVHRYDLACACLLALKLQVMKDLTWVCKLLVENANTAIVEELQQLITKTRKAGLKRLLKESLIDIVRKGLPIMEIHTLNQFMVKLDGRPISRSQWKGSGARRFFAILLAFGGRNVPQDLIMDALWPDASPRAVKSNFKSALHRLRKIISPDIGRYQRSPYLYSQDGLVGLDEFLCRIDFEDFEQTAKKAFNTDDEVQGFHLLRQALDLYEGAFMPTELYISCINRQRERLTNIYTKLLKKISKYYFDNREYKNAKDCLNAWLVADPYADEACRQLLHTYQKMGQPNQALRCFSEFQNRLQRDLQIMPDSKTMALYQKILNHV